MRLLLAADLHYSLPQFDWLVEVAADFDMLVIAGDHLDIGSIVDGRAQSIIVRKYFERLAPMTRLLVCSGNHDLDARDPEGEKIAKWLGSRQTGGVASDGESVVVGETMFTICPWWDGPRVRAGIEAQLSKASLSRPEHWVWIHHAPPNKSPVSWGGQRFFGDVELRQWIEKYGPDIVMSGHVHQSPFVKDGSWIDQIGSTWVFNAGHQFGAPPAHIIIDTDASQAIWISAAGNQIAHLDAPLERPVARLEHLPDWLKGADPSPGPNQV